MGFIFGVYSRDSPGSSLSMISHAIRNGEHFSIRRRHTRHHENLGTIYGRLWDDIWVSPKPSFDDVAHG